MSETEQMRKSWIPKILDERLQELCKRIKPVVRFVSWFGKGKECLYYIKPVDPRKIAYTWDPKPRRKARRLKKLCDITTYHSYGYYGFFKPSIAEVIAQIPEEYLNKVVAFEIVENPEKRDDLNLHSEALNAGYHVATTRLYIR